MSNREKQIESVLDADSHSCQCGRCNLLEARIKKLEKVIEAAPDYTCGCVRSFDDLEEILT